jgi:hypothetical protein
MWLAKSLEPSPGVLEKDAEGPLCADHISGSLVVRNTGQSGPQTWRLLSWGEGRG